jgi:hypothetical protein
MKVRILKSCTATPSNRRCEPGEIVEVNGIPQRAIEMGLVEVLIDVPENVPDMRGTYE